MRPRVLVIEDDADLNRALAMRLAADGLEAIAAFDGMQAVAAARRERPDAILLDLGLPGGDGLSVLRRLKDLPDVQGIPVVVLSAWDARDFEPRARAAGAADYLPKPVDAEALLTALRGVLPAPATPSPRRPDKPRLLLVDDEEDLRFGLSLRLQAEGYAVEMASDVTAALVCARRHFPDVVLLDLGLPGGGGTAVLEQFRRHPLLSKVPVIVLSAWDPEFHREAALDAGARDYLQKPADNADLIASIERELAARRG